MKEISTAWNLLNELHFTNKEISEFTGLTEVGIRKIRSGLRGTSTSSEGKILEFLENKIACVNAQIVQYKRTLSKWSKEESQA